MEWIGTRSRRLAAAVLVAGLASGCGAESVEEQPAAPTLSGKVTIKGAEGQVPRLDRSQVRAKLTADPSKELIGVIDSDGAFSLGLPTPPGATPGAELPPGEYVARIVPASEDKKNVRELPIKPKYLAYTTSGLRFQVPAAGGVTLELERGR